jgi:hypothetical protein
VRVAVNVSAVQFNNAELPQRRDQRAGRFGTRRPDRLELELTESVFMGDSEATEKTFAALKQLGVRLALDDFGTGYSSLSYLRSAPFDKLKVDKSFVDSCTQQDKNSAKIITAIIGLPKRSGWRPRSRGSRRSTSSTSCASAAPSTSRGGSTRRRCRPTQIAERMSSGEMRIEPQGPEKHRPERRSVFRRVGVIHDDHRYEAVMRNLSTTGARSKGCSGCRSAPAGARPRRGPARGRRGQPLEDTMIAIEFETPLVSDGAGGLCTRHRVSPYALAAAGMPLAALPPGHYPLALTQRADEQTAVHAGHGRRLEHLSRESLLG